MPGWGSAIRGKCTVNDRLSVMLVEDEIFIAQMVHDALREGGFDVTMHSSGADAWHELDSSLPPPILVTDIHIGDGPNGWEIARHARDRRPDLAVVYMTGAAADEWPVHGVSDSLLLQKPFTEIQIVTAVCKLVYLDDRRSRPPVLKQHRIVQ